MSNIIAVVVQYFSNTISIDDNRAVRISITVLSTKRFAINESILAVLLHVIALFDFRSAYNRVFCSTQLLNAIRFLPITEPVLELLCANHLPLFGREVGILAIGCFERFTFRYTEFSRLFCIESESFLEFILTTSIPTMAIAICLTLGISIVVQDVFKCGRAIVSIVLVDQFLDAVGNILNGEDFFRIVVLLHNVADTLGETTILRYTELGIVGGEVTHPQLLLHYHILGKCQSTLAALHLIGAPQHITKVVVADIESKRNLRLA